MACCILFLSVFLGILAPISSAARAFFVFGDSLVDSGNNNYLATTARADAPPYGLDSAEHRASGRFSNGKNTPDILSEQLGAAEPPLPYLSPHLDGQKLLIGANFASAGIGILNDTGIQFANIIRIEKQLYYFEQYQQRLSKLIGAQEAKRLVNNGIVLITLGGNDFVNNYYLIPYSARSREFSLPDYIPFVISEYKKVLSKLYGLGARRVLVTGVGPLGCVPAELALRSRTGACDPELMRVPDLWNPQLTKMLGDLNRQFGSDVFIAVNADRMHMDIVMNPGSYGFVTSKIACCGQGPYNGIGLCTIFSNVCSNRDAYVFWDAYHPTERANRIIFSQFMTGSSEYMYPMNLSTILKLDAQNQY
ncbi:GDSL esterase/lipase [Rhynchospora pubera]|uniref:GDSL esterase/lipase n=1 Tax=Rhynchospora pubera TaxID=906938 RepID=A0AAV8GIX2_9POAL|nr:GDSL esterase/lipase [Rhynchospora pubera]